MGLIKNSRVAGVLFAITLFLARGIDAQDAAPGQLGAEIQNLEQRLSLTGVSPIQRHDALVRLAQLRQLSGNIAAAAVNWLDAAAADPNDDAALVSGACCLAAIGEWEKAALALRPLLASDRQGPSVLEARYLGACLIAWMTNDASTLAALSGDSEFAALRPMIYYTLWQTIVRNPGVRGADNAETWKSRLLAEFPQSPEARAADPEKQKDTPAVSAVQSPLWLLFPGAAGSVPVEPPRPAVMIPPPAPAAAENTPVTVVLQTGLFSREANARSQSDALQKAGFSATISRKLVNGAEYWAVTVPAGQDTNKTIQELKKAGFDSFQVK